MSKKDELLTNFYPDVVTNSLTASESDISSIKKYFSEDTENPFDASEIAIFEGWLSNNIIDRSINRVPIETLKSLNKTIVGKPKLIHHDIDEIPDGRFFKSRLEKVDISKAMEIIGETPYKQKDFEKMLNMIQEKDGGLYWMVATFYMLQGTPEEKSHVRKVRAGLLHDMSLTFYVPSKWAVLEDGTEVEVSRWHTELVYDDKKILYFEWRNAKEFNAESIEGSHVYLGRLRGTISQQNDVTVISNRLSLLVNGFDKGEIDVPEINNKNDTNIDNNVNNENNEDVEENAEWSTAYIDSLEDNCFAVVENTGKKDDEGKTIPRTARHLPHHPKGKGAAGTGGTLDMAHFNNARARMNQITPVTKTISVQGLRDKAKKHLDAHSEVLKKQKSSNLNMENFQMELQISGFEKNFTVLQDSLEEDLSRMQKSVNHKIDTVVSEKESLATENETLKTENKKLEKFSNDFTDKLGESTFDELAQAKKDSEILKNYFIDETLTMKKLAGYEVNENSKESFQKMTLESVMEMHKEFKNQAAVKTGTGWLKGDFEELPNEDNPPEDTENNDASDEDEKRIITPDDVPDSFRSKFVG